MGDETGKPVAANNEAVGFCKPPVASRFKKGKSGNPSGRPKKVIDVLALAKDGSEKAIQKLVKLIDSEDERTALTAAVAVLDRAVGKPNQSVKVDAKHQHSGSEPVSDTAQWIAEALRRRADSETKEPLPH